MSRAQAPADDRLRLQLARVVFTGRLASMTRREAAEAVRCCGGQVTTSVSKRTSMLVVGSAGWPLFGDGTISRRLQRAEQLNQAAAHIQIVPEDAFLELVGLKPPRASAAKQYRFPQVVELLGLTGSTLRRWEAMGLIRSTDGCYDFQDIVSLRTIAELIGAGVSPQTIAASIRGLSRVLPGTDRPLAQLKIVKEHCGVLCADLGDRLIAPDGQLAINFQTDHGGVDSADPLPMTVGQQRDDWSAEQWIESGRHLEAEEQFDAAVEAYRKSLALQPAAAEAHFNLGNALRGTGRLEAAQEQLSMAVTLDPSMAVAWYNLADVQEEIGCLAAAIVSLERAIDLAPAYADAHYNLALCYMQADRYADAMGRWRRYLELDADSPWAETARAELARCGQ